jgi:hypothetical protein
MDLQAASNRAQIILQDTHSQIFPVAFGYLGATKEKVQPFCGNIEGWGPLSPNRYDFTPCFLDVWISSVAAFGILFGSGAVWWLLKRNTAQPVPKNWHFYTKLVSLEQENSDHRMIADISRRP